MKPHYLTALQADNFKRLVAVSLDISPTGELIEICGKNAAGKSSLLDSVFAAIAGAKASPDQPIHNGRSNASVSLEIGDLYITRKWNSTRGTSLVVTDAQGNPKTSPQAILDRLYNGLTFDPLAFLSMDAKRQAETLRRLVGLDFSDLDAKRKEAYEERSEINRAVKAQEARLGEFAEWDGPTEEVSVAALSRELTEGLTTVNRNNERRRKLREARIEQQRDEQEVKKLQEQIETIKDRLYLRGNAIERAEPEIAALIDPDTDSISIRMESAEAVNRCVRANSERLALLSELETNRQHAQRLTEEIGMVDDEKTARLASVQFPVDGLAVDQESITFNGVVFDQVSTSEKIRTCLAISAALNPALRLILIREGSLLDVDNLKVVAEFARDKGYQILMERVSDDINGTGVVIEAGTVKEAKGEGITDRRRKKGSPTPQDNRTASTVINNEPEFEL